MARKTEPMETTLPLIAFVVASTVTPGPNNLMVLASGANWGLGRTLPHILGIVLGFPVMILAVGLGVSAVFEAAPWLHAVLKYVAFAYLVLAGLADRHCGAAGRGRRHPPAAEPVAGGGLPVGQSEGVDDDPQRR